MKYPGYIQGVGGFEFRSSLLQLGNELEHALQMLPNLKSVNLDLKEATPPGPNPHLWDTKDMATETAINAIVSAASRGTLSSLAVHRLPLQILCKPDNRARWFQCAPSFGPGLKSLVLTPEAVEPGRPQSSVRAINGLGRVLRFASNLTHLSLEFVNSAILYQRFPLDFQELFSDFTFEKLTDLKLGGFACTESELGSFLLRHAATLERLRLGGRAARILRRPGGEKRPVRGPGQITTGGTNGRRKWRVVDLLAKRYGHYGNCLEPPLRTCLVLPCLNIYLSLMAVVPQPER